VHVGEVVVLYHEVMATAWSTVSVNGLRKSDRGDKTDPVTERADALLDEHRPATVREAGISRQQVVYAYLSVDRESLVDIDTGDVVTASDYCARREQFLLRIIADPSRCYVSDLEAYDRVVAAVQAGDVDVIDQSAREYWSLVVPLRSYHHGQLRRPEAMIGHDVTPAQIERV